MERYKSTSIKQFTGKLLILQWLLLGLCFFLLGCGSGVKMWQSTMPIAVVSREEGSGTRGAFVELIGLLEEEYDLTTLEAIIGNSTAVIKTAVAGDIYGIGYISIGALDESVKAVAIDGVAATEENARNGLYLISRPFNIAVTEGLDNSVAKDFIAFIMSREGQEVVAASGFIADLGLPAFPGILQPHQDSLPFGRIVVGGSTSVAPVMERLIEAYKKHNPQVEIELQVTGSSAGMNGVLDGYFDIGMASRELGESELVAGLQPLTIARDGIAVIVHPENPIAGMTREQVAGIFAGEIVTWDEVITGQTP